MTESSTVDVSLVPTQDILQLRDLHRQEMDCQIILDSWHARGWTESYVLRLNGSVVGYGSVGGYRDGRKDSIVEFYVLPEHRGAALVLFRRLTDVSQATNIEAQTNDVLLTLMLFDTAINIERNEVLFHDGIKTNLSIPGSAFRKLTNEDRNGHLALDLDTDAEYVIEAGGVLVATGGVLFHYNPPYGDIYMTVSEPFRRRGFGSYIIQELKQTCYEAGKIPAARCSPKNVASRATLQRAGMFPCARMLAATIV